MSDAKPCSHPGKVWTDGDRKWKCMDCGREETVECSHPFLETVYTLDGAHTKWCLKCKRVVD